MFQKTNMSGLIGKAGEYAVAANLMARGINVYFPAVDKDIDLIAGTSVKIQVKTSRKASYRSEGAGYSFGIGNKRVGKYAQEGKYLREYAGIVDFLVFVGLDEMKFWIIPSSVMGKFPAVQTLTLGGNHKRFVDRERLASLLETDLRQCDIAKVMGLHPVIVSEFARGKYKPIRAKFHCFNVEAEKYEGAWQEIISVVEQRDQKPKKPSRRTSASRNKLDQIDQEFQREFNTPEALELRSEKE
jgi:hypothetical protein